MKWLFVCYAASELDSIKALFNEKEKELATAVSKVEELTNQLAQLRNGHLNSGLNGDVSHPSIVGELEKLRNELSVSQHLIDVNSHFHSKFADYFPRPIVPC